VKFSLFALLLMISPVFAGDPAARRPLSVVYKCLRRRLPGRKETCAFPFSIQSALAMTYGGAEGTTRSEMAAALDFPADASTLASSFESLNASLLKSAERGGKDTALNVANRLFGAKGFALRAVFLALCKDQFGAPLEAMDFRTNPAAAAQHINKWIEAQPGTGLAISFRRARSPRIRRLFWPTRYHLRPRGTRNFQTPPTFRFHVNGGSGDNVPAITRTDSFGYRKVDGFTLVGVPFRGGDFQFLILLPDQSGPLPPLTDDILSGGIKLPSADVALTLPKFRLEPPTLPLGEILQSLGMKSAFDIPQSANFDGIAPRQPDDYLYISDVFHKVFFALDEKGIEAAGRDGGRDDARHRDAGPEGAARGPRGQAVLLCRPARPHRTCLLSRENHRSPLSQITSGPCIRRRSACSRRGRSARTPACSWRMFSARC